MGIHTWACTIDGKFLSGRTLTHLCQKLGMMGYADRVYSAKRLEDEKVCEIRYNPKHMYWERKLPSGSWTVIKKTQGAVVTDKTKNQILEELERSTKPRSVEDLTSALGFRTEPMSRRTMNLILQEMRDEGIVEKTYNNKWVVRG